MKIAKGNLLIEILAPAVGRVIELGNRIETEVQATVAIIALQRYRQDKGQYPDSLNDLIAAGFLKELPIDPWSDKPLIYRKTDTGFTLYSVGLNFKDDGGVPAKDKEAKITWDDKEGDAVFWPAAK
jgi:type II secretory pathway pseudopilin PulG